jgi:uncharacterized protein (DUF4213/DUF364 family)
MSITPEYLDIAKTVANRIPLPRVSRLYLPELNPDPEFRDEFALLFLDNGVVAPFYASLPGTLDSLHRSYADIATRQHLLIDLIQMMNQDDPAARALGLGAYNAMSQHLMRSAGLLPLDKSKAGNMGSAELRPGEQVGMVGYFCPLIDKLVDQGHSVLLIEQQPERVPERPGVTLSQNAADLASCRVILCTAATLINDSVDDILKHCLKAENFSLIGPSGSGLPDALFQHGVDAVGGVFFSSTSELDDTLASRSSWGKAGQKYQLHADSYPGYRALLDKVLNK